MIGIDKDKALLINKLVTGVSNAGSIQQKIIDLSKSFLGTKYQVNPLSPPSGPEEMRVQLDGVDCVTFCETVIALALSNNDSDFVDQLRKIRYLNGEVSWQNRNHYMTEWAKANQENGIITNITPTAEMVPVTKNLSSLKEYPQLNRTFSILPLQKFKNLSGTFQSGDVVLFASSRTELDIFHLGFLIFSSDGTIIVRHASKGLGGVVDEEFDALIARSGDVPGVVVLRVNEPI